FTYGRSLSRHRSYRKTLRHHNLKWTHVIETHVHNKALSHAMRDLWRVEGAYVREVTVCGIAPLPPYAASRIAAPFFSATLLPCEVCDTQFLHVLPYGAPFSKHCQAICSVRKLEQSDVF